MWKKGEDIIALGDKILNDKDRRVQVKNQAFCCFNGKN
jgi:hypothetical protein